MGEHEPPEAELAALGELIRDLNSRPPLSQSEIRSFDEARRFNFIDHMDLPEDELKTAAYAHSERWRSRLFDGQWEESDPNGDFIRKRNQDMSWQIGMFKRGVEDWFERGITLPPHYANRIATILRKAKLLDLEAQFLRSYFRHFRTSRGGATDIKLAARAEKIGIEPSS